MKGQKKLGFKLHKSDNQPYFSFKQVDSYNQKKLYI